MLPILFVLVLTAESKIQMQSGNILTAINLEQTFSKLSTNIGGIQTTMDAKLKQLSSIASTLPFTIQFQESATATYSIHGLTGSAFMQKVFTVVEFDVKPTTLNGIMWYMVSHTATAVCKYQHINYLH